MEKEGPSLSLPGGVPGELAQGPVYVSQAHKEICEALDRKNAERAREEEKKTGKKRFSLGSLSGIHNIDSADGLVEELKRIIQDPKEKTQDRLRAIQQVSEIRGYANQADLKAIRRWPQEQIDSAMADVVAPAVKPFLVLRGGRDAASA